LPDATVRTVVLSAALFFALLSVAACATGAPSGVSVGTELPEASEGAEGLLLIAHGYRNNPSHWPARLIRDIREAVPEAAGWGIYAHDWEAVANRPLTAPRRGYAIGAALAERLLSVGDPYPVIQLIGQSLGAHLVQGFIDSYREGGGGAYLHASFLDPFLIRGLFGLRWGVRNFGRGADFAENYVVSDDPALGTNGYLRHAHNFDISALVPPRMREELIGPHWWVVRFYRESVTSGPSTDGGPDKRQAVAGPVGFGLSPMARDEFGGASRRRYPAGEVTVLN